MYKYMSIQLNIVRKLSASSYVQVTLAASRVRGSDGVFQSNRLGRMIDWSLVDNPCGKESGFGLIKIEITMSCRWS